MQRHSAYGFSDYGHYAACFILFVLTVNSDHLVPVGEPVPVETPCGTVVGTDSGVLTSFLGIPFANAKRFEPSQAASCWSGTLDATKLGPCCFNVLLTPQQPMSEDCLNLNIYYASRNQGNSEKKLLPVLFFVYGGGNVVGYNTFYGIDKLAVEIPDIIIVSPNYRIGTLGYFVHKPSGMTGNYGISDLVSALNFVRLLLPSFGGDPDKITIMGQSSGGSNVYALLAYPGSKGLFSRAIILSAGSNISASVETTSDFHKTYILPAVGCNVSDDQVKSCLLKRDPLNLTNGLYPLMDLPPSVMPPLIPASPNGNNGVGLLIVDGIYVTMPLHKALSIPVVDVPLIIQTAQAELEPTNLTIDNLDPVLFKAWLGSYFSQNGWNNSEDLAQKICALYKDELNSSSADLGFESWLTDVGATCGHDFLAKIATTKFTSSVYRTLLTAPPSHTFDGQIAFPTAPGPKNFSFHTWDMPVTVNNQWYDFKPEKSDLELGMSLRKMWQFFMIHGKMPGGFFPGECTNIGPLGIPSRCSRSKCRDLFALGFDDKFWWYN